MIKKKFVFFSANDFVKEGGGSIRMLGIMNELADQGYDVTFISNARSYTRFNSSIKHIFLAYEITPAMKRKIQSCLAFMPYRCLNLAYGSLLQRLKEVFAPYKDTNVYFFEYLDTSIGFWLYKNKVLKGYINDLHGVATLEFDFQYRHAKSLKQKIIFFTKYLGAKFLDNKVFKNAAALIYASKAMRSYYLKIAPYLADKRYYILPYVLEKKQLSVKINEDLKQKLIEQLEINEKDKVVFFAGVFKHTGGVPDLINAIAQLDNSSIRVLLVGDGPSYEECESIIANKKLSRVKLLGRVPYADLRTYQDLANIIVCPDRQNIYSQLIIHVKYLDALVSGKIVINGAFESVREINEDEKLSLLFTPSDVDSLAKTIQRALNQEEELKKRYDANLSYVKNNLTYETVINVLLD